MNPDTAGNRMAIDFEDVNVPINVTNAESTKKWRDTHPGAFAVAKKKYRHDNSKYETDVSYLSRPFVAWDGEGVTIDRRHVYVMLAVKSPNGSDSIENEYGLGTSVAFDFLLAHAALNPNAIHVIYGGGYDFNMIMRDLNRTDLEQVYKRKFATWRGYRIGWRQGKSFYVCKVDVFGNKVGKGITIYDVVSFFQCAFVKACDSYLGDRFTNREMIVENKALRSAFKLSDVPSMRVYNDAELTNLLALMVELRSRLNKAGLRPKRWDGPGAVAAALLMREDVKSALVKTPEPVASAARFAYAGGRFEVVRFGHVEKPAYEYDVNSAYPAGLINVPDLSRGVWEHVNGDPGSQPFALYHIYYEGGRMDLPGALFRRDYNGTIGYGTHLTGWYWSPEYESTKAYCKAGYGEFKVLDAWVFHPTGERKPFEFIEKLYNKRRALKLAGDGAHVGIKLAINSIYGKMAQQVGWERKKDGTLSIPPFHQLEYAGYTTSYCRARVLMACLPALETVIAFETDAVFTSEPLPGVKVGNDLGEFEMVEFTDLTYVQSGLYFGTKKDGTPVNKTRGVDRGSMTRKQVVTALGHCNATDREVVATLTRFVGAGVALAQSWERWRTWETAEKHMSCEPTGKRMHAPYCTYDLMPETGRITFGEWHLTVCPLMEHAHSHEFPVQWINPNPNMDMLDELRNTPNDYE